ncbi:tyrosine-type recombinase/integrase [Photobacterium sagamiensis]|uniref:tyrosine-type recombinase/integrase n=1 Tax=Photobacterium sagamiensis TaxID=2910241 RepID=UPI003D136F37
MKKQTKNIISERKVRLKAKLQAKRKGTRKSVISLDKKDYEPNSVAYQVCHVMKTKKRRVADTTFTGMKPHARHIIKRLGNNVAKDLSATDIEDFVEDMFEYGVEAKVINGCFTILRAVFVRVHSDSNVSPMKRIENYKLSGTKLHPLSEDELKVLFAQVTPDVMSKMMFMCGVLTACRVSELPCWTWENVEFFDDAETGKEHARVTIDLAKPANDYKVVKTPDSERTIVTSPECAQILRVLEKRTAKLKPIEFDVIQRDNRSVEIMKRRFVFYNDQTGQPWLNPKQFSKQFFTSFLKEAGISHRGPGQLRHTCASLHYAKGVSLAWIAKLLGHKSTSIVEKHYARANEVNLKSEQQKADATIATLFKTINSDSIIVNRDVLLKQNKLPQVDLPALLARLRSTSDDSERDALCAQIELLYAMGV